LNSTFHHYFYPFFITYFYQKLSYIFYNDISIWINECYYLNILLHTYYHYFLLKPLINYYLTNYKSFPFILNNTVHVIYDLIFAGISVYFYAVIIILIYPDHNKCLLLAKNCNNDLSFYYYFIYDITSSNMNKALILFCLSV
jgi:hypothetical protein